MVTYTGKFYRNISRGSSDSAQEIVPIIIDLINPMSVLDVGCGVGTWLAEFRKMGIEDIVGVDGGYIDQALLQIPQEAFTTADLKKALDLKRKFDLVVSLEVAEHIPASCVETFIDSLVLHGPVVVFSAAIPYQGGTHHVNEQWQDYWSDLFLKRGYVVIDAIRKNIWNNEIVEVWYKQNILVYAKECNVNSNTKLYNARLSTTIEQISLVHPDIYLYNNKPSVRNVITMILNLIKQIF